MLRFWGGRVRDSLQILERLADRADLLIGVVVRLEKGVQSPFEIFAPLFQRTRRGKGLLQSEQVFQKAAEVADHLAVRPFRRVERKNRIVRLGNLIGRDSISQKQTFQSLFPGKFLEGDAAPLLPVLCVDAPPDAEHRHPVTQFFKLLVRKPALCRNCRMLQQIEHRRRFEFPQRHFQQFQKGVGATVALPDTAVRKGIEIFQRTRPEHRVDVRLELRDVRRHDQNITGLERTVLHEPEQTVVQDFHLPQFAVTAVHRNTVVLRRRSRQRRNRNGRNGFGAGEVLQNILLERVKNASGRIDALF